MITHGTNVLDRPPLGDDLARLIAGEIIRHRPRPGTKLVETKISARHGVSRSPLREAFRILESWSLVERRPRYGVRVAPMSVTHLDNLVTCRLPLEARAAALIASLPDHRRVAANLRASLDQMATARMQPDVEACFSANLAMMETFHQANPNPVLAQLLSELNPPAQRYRHLVYRFAPETVGMLIESNALLINAIQDGDPDQAFVVTEKMIQGAWNNLRAHLPDYLMRAAQEARQ